MLKKLVLFMILACFLSVNLVAAVFVKYSYVDENNQPVTNFFARGFVCQDYDCFTVGAPLWNGGIISSTNNYIILDFPSTLQGPSYVFYVYQNNYMVRSKKSITFQESTAPGTTYQNPYVVSSATQLKKQPSCASPTSLAVVNNVSENLPVVINTSSNIDSSTRAAFGFSNQVYNGPLLTQGYESYFEIETTLNLKIYNYDNVNRKNVGSAINTQTLVKRIYYDSTVNAGFASWTPPAPGYYNVTVQSVVTDPKCSSNIPQTSSQIVQVWAAYPRNECYSLVQSLVQSPSNPQYRDTVTFTFQKLTNYANDYDVWNPLYSLFPRASKVVLTINGAEQATYNYNLPANVNTNYATQYVQWNPSTYGNYQVQLVVKANDATCPRDTQSNPLLQSLTINPPPSYNLVFNVKDNFTNNMLPGATVTVNNSFSQYSLQTNSQGTITFNLVRENYTYTVSKANYFSRTGSINLVQQATKDVALAPTSQCPGVDTATDPNNCGQCSNVCNLPNANEVCISGQCKIGSCSQNFFDLNLTAADGCEYQCTKTQNSETSCQDSFDNDCDGKKDCLDPDCLNVLTGAFNVCTCTQTNNGIETCDGADNDCDGAIDDNILDAEVCDNRDNNCNGLIDDIPLQQCGLSYPQEGVCLEFRAYCISGIMSCDNNNYEPISETRCDNLDNDCDGMVDENIRRSASEVGACSFNTELCVNGTFIKENNYIAVEEICGDNTDNDCDGETDETCFCTPGETKTCGPSDVGECSFGTQECGPFRIWEDCNAIMPMEEICDGKDNDCDGIADDILGCCENNDIESCFAPECSIPGLKKCVNFVWTGCSAQCGPVINEVIVINPEIVPILPNLTIENATLKVFVNAENSIEIMKREQNLTKTEIADAQKTGDSINQSLSFTYEGNNTKVKHTITSENELKDVKLYLYLPKDCVAELEKLHFFDERLKNYDVIKEDPLIAWHFVEIKDKIDISYDIDGKISEDCLNRIKMLPIAKKIGKPIEYIIPILAIIAISSLAIFMQHVTPGEAKENPKKDFFTLRADKYAEQMRNDGIKTKDGALKYVNEMRFPEEMRKEILKRF